ncbi:MAG: hypothetical protein BWY15_01672 [Firmicutes bacterium ADurb.Bin193]|nr:MAG: hypothetical protein BWY15_01672 [Firmicutes bacterium ADurb.Bin193]
MDTKVVKDICREKWAAGFDEDTKTKKALAQFDVWLAQIPDKYKELSLVLIQNLEYFPRDLINKLLMELHKKLIKLPAISDDNTIYAYIKSKDGKTNSSDEYWTMYKLLNDVNREFCYENINAINNWQWAYVKNIVFIDDFSGTGKSIIKELKKNESRYIGKNIYFITICVMEDAIQKIKNYSKLKKMNIVPVFCFMHKKTFARELFENNEDAKDSFIALTTYLKIPEWEYPLGFEKSEALVAFHNNTPNNTLSIIRCDTKEYKSLFPRRHENKPFWDKMKSQSKGRKVANYKNKFV